MYIVIKQDPLHIRTFEAKVDLANYLGLHRHTITQRFKDSLYWEHEKGTVYQSNIHKKRFRSGNTDSLSTRKEKKERGYTDD